MADFKKTTPEELKKLFTEKQKAIQAFRFGSAGSKTKNVKEGKNLRKEVARILTELNSRKSETTAK
jgi:ribosomal protein L29